MRQAFRLFHFGDSFFGEIVRNKIHGVTVAVTDYVGYAVYENRRFSASGSGKNKIRTVYRIYALSLHVVELLVVNIEKLMLQVNISVFNH